MSGRDFGRRRRPAVARNNFAISVADFGSTIWTTDAPGRSTQQFRDFGRRTTRGQLHPTGSSFLFGFMACCAEAGLAFQVDLPLGACIYLVNE
ncbi:hypothetical protein M569_02393 [Genlisea aurea]|uniref:Uncharacterized protein n=1 Tax=Genlisea aurea TaxID=192259 RepID=S8D4U9_9LAMI|nr:hypothetical protein M569_02393 [Genlisea aurea]